MRITVVGTLLAGLLATSLGDELEASLASSHCSEQIERDVAILGGGASGSYAAVQLRQTYNKSVVVIERKNAFGGPAEAYVDPETNGVINYGVLVYNDYGNARKFLAQMNVSTQGRVAYPGHPTTVYIDPYSGHQIQNYTAPSWPQVIAAMSKLHEVVKQYDDMLVPGYWNFPEGKDIPEDLLLPWSDFVAKYHLEDVFWALKIVAGPDGSPEQLTLYVLINLNSIVIRAYIDGTSFDPNPFDMRILYKNVKNYLGKDALVSTNVIKTKRTNKGVTMVAQGPDGRKTCIKAKQLLITVQPSLKNLATMDLDKEEKKLFSTWKIIGNFVFLMKTNFIPTDKQITFMSPTSEDLPFNLNLEVTNVPNIYRVVFNSMAKLYTLEEAHVAVEKYMNQAIAGGVFNGTTTDKPSFKFLVEADYTSPFYGQSAEMLKAGFFHQQYALEGKRSTWYTGGLWSSSFSANVWAFTDTVLPKMMKQAAEKK